MSGGSYNYLCFRDADELVEREKDLQEMADRLAELGYADDAAKETQDILLTVRQFKNRIQTSIDRISDVWKAVEWTDSCDSTENSIKKALDEYRGGL